MNKIKVCKIVLKIADLFIWLNLKAISRCGKTY